MIELKARCPAKINLFLHIVGRRPDGYHLLESIFCPVGPNPTAETGLYDDLRLTLDARQDSQLSFHRTGALLNIPEEKDLTVRACKAFFGKRNTPGWNIGIEVHKRIPEQAGLGGGSSNAAYVLRLLHEHFPLSHSKKELMDLALSLGADVPFFMQDECAYVEGIGEQITPIEGLRSWLLIYKPKENCPTSEIFASDQLTRDSSPVKIAVFDSDGLARSNELPNKLQKANFKTGWKVSSNPRVWQFLKNHTQNSMQTVVEQKLPSWQTSFNEFCRLVNSSNPWLVRMSGSGSAWFAAFESKAQSEQAYAVLRAAAFDQRGSLFQGCIK